MESMLSICQETTFALRSDESNSKALCGDLGDLSLPESMNFYVNELRQV